MTDIYNLGNGFLTSATYINDQALGGKNSMPEPGLCYISLVQKHISGDFPQCLRPTSQKCPVKLLPQPQCICSPSLHFHKNMSQLSVHVSPSLEEDESAENDEECDRQAGAAASRKSMGRADEDTTKYQRLKRQKLSDSSHSSLHFSKTPNTQTRTKEKFGDRITALQQLVSPFGKTDTASVLLEAIGYIKFLQDQVQVLSSPYMKPMMGHQGQLEGKGEMICDLKSRGLCLVPVSCTLHVANSNGADYWTSGLGGGNSQH